jgi:hypothetical protein
MTEPSPSTDEMLAARYGKRTPQHRRRVIAAIAVLAMAALAFLLWIAWDSSNPSVRGALEGYEVTSTHQVEVVIAVERDSGAAATCLVQAQASDHAVVGEQTATIPAGAAGSVRFEVTVPTEREAASVTVTNCR